MTLMGYHRAVQFCTLNTFWYETTSYFCIYNSFVFQSGAKPTPLTSICYYKKKSCQSNGKHFGPCLLLGADGRSKTPLFIYSDTCSRRDRFSFKHEHISGRVWNLNNFWHRPSEQCARADLEIYVAARGVLRKFLSCTLHVALECWENGFQTYSSATRKPLHYDTVNSLIITINIIPWLCDKRDETRGGRNWTDLTEAKILTVFIYRLCKKIANLLIVQRFIFLGICCKYSI